MWGWLMLLFVWDLDWFGFCVVGFKFGRLCKAFVLLGGLRLWILYIV